MLFPGKTVPLTSGVQVIMKILTCFLTIGLEEEDRLPGHFDPYTSFFGAKLKRMQYWLSIRSWNSRKRITIFTACVAAAMF